MCKPKAPSLPLFIVFLLFRGARELTFNPSRLRQPFHKRCGALILLANNHKLAYSAYPVLNIRYLARHNSNQNVTTIADNIERLSDRLQRFERQYERSAASVKLLAVSKRHSVESIIAANKAGIEDFGENYLQEALDKIQHLSSIRVNWHFIGPVQANKTKAIAENFQWVHSIDRLKIARRLSDQREPSAAKLNVCVQVKLSQETSKSGVEIGEAEALCDSLQALPNLQLRGLMAIPAAEPDSDSQRIAFRALAKEYSRLKPCYAQFDTLSMGMSNDFEAAIAEGSTLIRIGTGIFGPRS